MLGIQILHVEIFQEIIERILAVHQPSTIPVSYTHLGTAIMVDMAGNYTAYMTDMTRVFSVGRLTEEAYRAHQVALTIQQEVENATRPGTACSDLYNIAANIAKKEGLSANFMGCLLYTSIKDINIIGNGPKALADITMVGNNYKMDRCV